MSRLPGNAAGREGHYEASRTGRLITSRPVRTPHPSPSTQSRASLIFTARPLTLTHAIQYNQSIKTRPRCIVLGVWSMSWARVQVVVRLHVVVSPERDEGGGFSVSFVSFAKFRKVSGRAAAGRPSGGVGPANGLCEAIIMAGARECVRCARSAEQEAGLMRAARRLCSSRESVTRDLLD